MIEEIIIESMLEKKALDVTMLDFSKLSNVYFSKFIVCHGTSKPHIEAIVENIDRTLRKNAQERPQHIEGLRNGEWVLMDYGELIVHVFCEESRKYYNLEGLWADCETIKYDSNS